MVTSYKFLDHEIWREYRYRAQIQSSLTRKLVKCVVDVRLNQQADSPCPDPKVKSE
jgi:hypothetical protein